MWLIGIECLEYSGDDVSIRRVPWALNCLFVKCENVQGVSCVGKGKGFEVSKGGNGERANLRPTYHTDLPC